VFSAEFDLSLEVHPGLMIPEKKPTFPPISVGLLSRGILRIEILGAFRIGSR